VVWWVLGVAYVLVVGVLVLSALRVGALADEAAEREYLRLRYQAMKERAVPPDESAG